MSTAKSSTGLKVLYWVGALVVGMMAVWWSFLGFGYFIFDGLTWVFIRTILVGIVLGLLTNFFINCYRTERDKENENDSIPFETQEE